MKIKIVYDTAAGQATVEKVYKHVELAGHSADMLQPENLRPEILKTAKLMTAGVIS